MPPSNSRDGVYGDSPDLAIAPATPAGAGPERRLWRTRHPRSLPRRPARPALGPQPRLLLGVSGTDLAGRRRLAALVAELLPDDLELDLIELEDDNLSQALRECCEAFYRR